MALAVNIAHRQLSPVSTLGERLKIAAEKRGYDLEQKAGRRAAGGKLGLADLSRASGVPLPALSLLKNGKRGGTRANGGYMRSLASVLDVRRDWLEFGEEPMQPIAELPKLAEQQVAAPPPVPRNGRERVWWLWHSLPLDARGKRPSVTALAATYGPGVADIFKDAEDGAWEEISPLKAQALAEKLAVSVEWLTVGSGAPPELKGTVAPLPERLALYRMYDTANLTSVLAADPRGTPPASTVNNYTTALDRWGARKQLTKKALKEIERDNDVAHRFNDLTVDGWTHVFLRKFQEPRRRKKQKPPKPQKTSVRKTKKQHAS